MLGSQPEAEDALQLVLLSAYHALRRDDRPIGLKPWLYTIARNRCTSVLRARRDERPIDDELHLSTAGLALADEVEQREDLRAVLGDVAVLPDDQRAALVLAELGNLTHEEIGVSLGVPTAKVKALIFQARSSLIGSRRARDTPCEQIREQLATLRGSALRRAEITRHLEGCAGCTAFREEVRLQRAALGCVLPVVPALMLKQQLLAGVLAGGASGAAGGVGGAVGAGAAASGATGATASGAATFVGAGSAATGATGTVGGLAGAGAAGGTGMLAAAGSSLGVAKVFAAVVLAGGIAGGAVAAERAVREPSRVPVGDRRLPPGGSAPTQPLRRPAPAATAVPGPRGAGPGQATKAPGPASRSAAIERRKAAARRREVRQAARKARAASEKARRVGGAGNGKPAGPAGASAAAAGSGRASGATAGSTKGFVATPGRRKSAPPTAKRAVGASLAARENDVRTGRAGSTGGPTRSSTERQRANSAP